MTLYALVTSDHQQIKTAIEGILHGTGPVSSYIQVLDHGLILGTTIGLGERAQWSIARFPCHFFDQYVLEDEVTLRVDIFEFYDALEALLGEHTAFEILIDMNNSIIVQVAGGDGWVSPPMDTEVIADAHNLFDVRQLDGDLYRRIEFSGAMFHSFIVLPWDVSRQNPNAPQELEFNICRHGMVWVIAAEIHQTFSHGFGHCRYIYRDNDPWMNALLGGDQEEEDIQDDWYQMVFPYKLLAYVEPARLSQPVFLRFDHFHDGDVLEFHFTRSTPCDRPNCRLYFFGM